MRAAAAVHESFWSRLVVTVDPAVDCWTRDSIRATQVTTQNIRALLGLRNAYVIFAGGQLRAAAGRRGLRVIATLNFPRAGFTSASVWTSLPDRQSTIIVNSLSDKRMPGNLR